VVKELFMTSVICGTSGLKILFMNSVGAGSADEHLIGIFITSSGVVTLNELRWKLSKWSVNRVGVTLGKVSTIFTTLLWKNSANDSAALVIVVGRRTLESVDSMEKILKSDLGVFDELLIRFE
jgi:hypothetical protein